MNTFLLVVFVWLVLSVVVGLGYVVVRRAWAKEDMPWSVFENKTGVAINVIKDKLLYKPKEVALTAFLASEEIKLWLRDFDYDVEEKPEYYVITLRTPAFARDFILDKQLFKQAS